MPYFLGFFIFAVALSKKEFEEEVKPNLSHMKVIYMFGHAYWKNPEKCLGCLGLRVNRGGICTIICPNTVIGPQDFPSDVKLDLLIAAMCESFGVMSKVTGDEGVSIGWTMKVGPSEASDFTINLLKGLKAKTLKKAIEDAAAPYKWTIGNMESEGLIVTGKTNIKIKDK